MTPLATSVRHRVGWHEETRVGFKAGARMRDDLAALTWPSHKTPGTWDVGPPIHFEDGKGIGTDYRWDVGWGATGFATADAAMRHADDAIAWERGQMAGQAAR